MNDVGASYRILRDEVGLVRLGREGVRVAGPDATAFLQGQLSQDVMAIGVRTAADSFVLSPNGKVDAYVRVVRLADDEFVLDIDAGFAEIVVTRLQRFRLRTKADIEQVPWGVVAVRGPATTLPELGDRGPVVAIAVEWPGLRGFDVVGPPDAIEAVDAVHLVPSTPTPWCDPSAYEVLRIEAGVPRMGAELDATVIPAEAGVVDRAVSFTKGCFTGQELVARIDSRGGNVPRRLRGIVLDGTDPPPPGAVIDVDGDHVGSITSAAYSPGFDRAVALGYLRRAVSPPASVMVGFGDGGVAGEVRDLPLTA